MDFNALVIVCAFNKTGTLLAMGCNDGRILILDFLSRSMSKEILAHVHPVTSVTWSENNRRIISSSTDNTVYIWDVITGNHLYNCRYYCPVMRVQLNPRNERQYLITPILRAPVLSENKQHKLLPVDEDGEPSNIACFDSSGKYIVSGNKKGRLIIIDLESFEVKARFNAASGTSMAIKNIEFSKGKDIFLVNVADKILRIFDLKTVLGCGLNTVAIPILKLQDLINKSMWKKCAFSDNGEYICASSDSNNEIYIWETATGSLIKILHGKQSKLILDFAWHPLHTTIVTLSSEGLSIWKKAPEQQWSAFSPDFEETDENNIYEEKESEFDAFDEDADLQIVVDTINVESCLDVDSNDDTLCTLPVTVIIENPEER